jgi:hypothetical protein
MKFAQLALGASFLAGMMTAPAMAANLTGATVTGGQYKVYQENPDNGGLLFEVTASDANALEALQEPDGTLASPGGNVELFSDSETNAYTSLGAFQTASRTTLTTVFDNGTEIAFTSLNGEDFFGSTPDYNYGASNLANEWFDAAFSANLAANGINEGLLFAISGGLGGPSSRAGFFNAFLGAGGFQRAADANISFVNLDDDGNVSYGLAGHVDLLFYAAGTPLAGLLTAFGDVQVQASELVKVAINGEPASEAIGADDGVMYSFAATDSDVVSADDNTSFSATYDPGTITVPGDSEDVPEPASVLGLVALGGLAVASKRKSLA